MKFNAFHKWLAMRFGGLTIEALLTKAGFSQGGSGSPTVLASVISTGTMAFDALFSSFGATSVDANNGRQAVMPRAGTLSDFFVKPNATPAPGSLISVVVFKNGVATTLTVDLPESVNAVVSDTTHSVEVVAGDLISVRFSNTDEEASFSLAGTAFSALLS